MPPLHRYLGNPVLSASAAAFSRAPAVISTVARGVERNAILALDLQAPGMEFASEMVVKATDLAALRITEVATTLSRDGRTRPPHLRELA